MKIIFFNNDKKIINEIEHLKDVKNYGFHEVVWKNGGYADFGERYIILEDNEQFEHLSKEKFIQQYKEQAIVELAKEIERNRVFFIANGILSEKENEFSKHKEKIISLESEEELMIEFDKILSNYKA
jgi:hypothetical protein